MYRGAPLAGCDFSFARDCRAGRWLANAGMGQVQPPVLPDPHAVVADVKADAVRRAAAAGAPPQVIQAAQSGSASVVAGAVVTALAGAAAAGTYAACIAGLAGTGVGAAAIPFICGAAGSAAAALVGIIGALSWEQAEAFFSDVFTGDEGFPRRSLDASTGYLRQESVPQQLWPLLNVNTQEPFKSGSGPFEGLWRLSAVPMAGEWGPTQQFPIEARLYDRDGWVLGPIVRVHTGVFTGNLLFRRNGNDAAGRLYWRDRNTWYPWVFQMDGHVRLVGTLPDNGQHITGERLEGPVRSTTSSGGVATIAKIGLVAAGAKVLLGMLRD